MDYGARFYDPAIGRFVSTDSIVSQPLDPQSLNRYSYVLNNPIKYQDPSGHCSSDRNNDLECWAMYDEVKQTLGFGYDPLGLDSWSLSDLAYLLTLYRAGVRFTSVPAIDPTSQQSATSMHWSGPNLRSVMNAFFAVFAYVLANTNNWQQALGVNNNGTLTFNSLQAGGQFWGQIGGWYNQASNTIDLYLSSGWPNASALGATFETAIHEMGHSIDSHAGNGRSWSTIPGNWGPANGLSGEHQYDAAFMMEAPTRYALSSVKEDFTESFVWAVMQHPRNFPAYGFDKPRMPGVSRLKALANALSVFQ